MSLAAGARPVIINDTFKNKLVIARTTDGREVQGRLVQWDDSGVRINRGDDKNDPVWIAWETLSVELQGAPEDEARWATVWAMPAESPIPGFLPQTNFNNQTIRQVMHVSRGGKRARFRFTNIIVNDLLPQQTLQIDAASLGRSLGGANATQLTPLTFNGGSPGISVAPGAECISDEVDFVFPGDSDVTVDLFFAGPVAGTSYQFYSIQDSYVGLGNQTNVSAFVQQPGPISPNPSFFFLSALEAFDDSIESPEVFGILGDSVTQGLRSTQNANRRYTDVLARRFLANPATRNVSIMARGTSGGRMTQDVAGPDGLGRLYANIMAMPNVRWCLIELGGNDFAFSQLPPLPPIDTSNVSAATMIAAYQQTIAFLKTLRIRPLIATIIPLRGTFTNPSKNIITPLPLTLWDPALEAKRNAVNAWVLANATALGFDVVDFSAVLTDPAFPGQGYANPLLVSPLDWFHPNDLGYQLLGEAFNLAIFTE